MGHVRAWSNKWSQVFLPNDSGPVQLPRTFLLTKQVHHTTWKFPTLATMQQKRTCIGKCANKGFCKCQKCLIRNFSWMYFRRPHQIRSIYISKSFLGLELVDFYSLWDSDTSSSRGHCFSACHQAACGTTGFMWFGKETHIYQALPTCQSLHYFTSILVHSLFIPKYLLSFYCLHVFM